MSEYHTEGFVKTVSTDVKEVRISIEAASTYLFESKEKNEDGSSRRRILLVTDDEDNAKIYVENIAFKLKKNELTALLIAKANHMKVRLSVDEKAIEHIPLVVSKLEML